MCLLSGLRQVAAWLHADILAAPDSELYDSSLPLHGRLSSDGDDGIVLTLLRDPAAASFTADPNSSFQVYERPDGALRLRMYRGIDRDVSV